MRNAILTLFATVAFTATLAAQAPTAYDQISVHVSPVTESNNVRRDPTSLHATGWPLDSILAMAYGVDPRLIVGVPAKDKHLSYNIDATISPAAGHGDSSTLLRSLLATQFGVEARMEHRDLPVYVLTLAPGGTLLQSAPPQSGNGGTTKDNGYITSSAAKMQQITRTIGSALDLPILDKTGLAGTYSIDLHYDASAPSGQARFQAIAKALHDQLGLDLKPGNGLIHVLVVEKLDTSRITAQAVR